MILVDSSVLISYFRGEKGREVDRFTTLLKEEPEELALSELIVTEVLQGIRDDLTFKKVKEILLHFSIISPGGLITYLLATDIYRICRLHGQIVRGTIDCLIAAIAIERNLLLLHQDRDFDKIARWSKLKMV